MVIFASYDGKVYGLDRNTGTKIWENNLNGAIFSTPAIKNTATPALSLLFIGTLNGTFRCINTLTGDTEWSISIPNSAAVWSSPALRYDAGGILDTVYFGTGSPENKLYALDQMGPSSGRMRSQMLFMHLPQFLLMAPYMHQALMAICGHSLTTTIQAA